MDSIADIEQQLKDLESVIGQVVILADSPTEEETTDVAEEHSTQVAQEKEEGLSLTASPPKNGATCLPISSSFDGDEIDEMGGSRDTWPYAQLRAQDLCDDTQSFCPWKVVVAYPDSFVGNANRPRVGSSAECFDVLFVLTPLGSNLFRQYPELPGVELVRINYKRYTKSVANAGML